MVKLNIIPKGGKFDVIDSKERVNLSHKTRYERKNTSS